MATGKTSGKKVTRVATGLIGHMLGLAFAVTSGSADAADTKPAPDAAQRRLQDTAWVLYQVNDVHGKAIAPFAESADGSRSILPVLFRTDYLEFATACGRRMAPYREESGQVIIAQAYASHDACKADAALAPSIARLRGEFAISFVAIAGTDRPALRLKAPSGDEFLLYDNGQLRFTDPSDVLPQPRVLYLQVGPDTMGCGYNGPDIPGRPENVCVVARAVKQGADGAWHADSMPYPVMPAIRGFEPPAGSRSIVRILRYELANPDIHASRYRDVLDMVIEQHPPKNLPTEYRNPPYHWIP
ncbi:hypothetical protein JR064_01050 [Xanthomonas sp. CFBP 8703]|uniref:Uncharacterized protein n=1 Tax=Xanthomonas bonasiae TaxID=2810351 RepID=A0ABS3B1I7_9XANT|nr:hypothetical protein [Xanthomonas bonasiae]MBN6100749.1 hypothetical protein [Xanthomonas bonasiae]